ncbi:MAG TPA: XdhC/CoxI family protein [Pyrinomonadaceae bacterium]|jgi:xanthine dehydrogenase accessory factor
MRQPSEKQALSLIPQAIARVLQESSIATLATLIEGPRGVGAKLLIEETGERTGSLTDPELDEAVARQAQLFLASRAEAKTFRVEELGCVNAQWRAARVLFERIEPEPHLVICGAGHVGVALATLARMVGYRTTLIDDRADFLARERFPDSEIELVHASDWTTAVRERVGHGRGVSIAVVTRGHNEDEECLRAAIKARPDYLGLIGSKRRTGIVLERLRETGAEESLLREVRAPIGLDIGAVTPAEVALAILAEIVAERRGGTGAPLSAWRREGMKEGN